MRFVYSALLVCAASLLESAETKGSMVEGRVTNAITNEPIRKATVTLQSGARRGGPAGNATYEATTDAGGSFKIEGVPDGEYRVWAERTGFVRAGQGGGSGDQMLRLAARGDKDSQSLTLKLTPHGVIAGRVLDEDGDPVQHAQIQILRRNVIGGKRQISPVQGTSTNDLGEFRVSGLVPGRYWVSASRRGRGFPYRGPGGMVRAPVRRQDSEQSYIPIFYPDAEDPARASEIPVAAGQIVQGVEMRLRKGHTYHIRGKVSGLMASESNERFGGPGAMVVVMPANGGAWSDRSPAPVSPRDGSFDASGLRPGRYILSAQQMRRDGKRSARVTVDVGEADVEGVELTMQESPGIKGRVVIEGEGQFQEMSLNLLELASTQFGGAFGRVKKEDGTFTTSPADPGQYRVQLGGMPQGFYLKSIHYGEREVSLAGFEIAAGAGELKLTIESGAPMVRGVVKDSKGDPAANVTVSAAPQDSLSGVWELYRTAKTDQQGAFELALQPGSFKIYAWEHIDSGEHQDSALLEKYASKAASAKLAKGDRQNVDLKLISIE